MFYLCAALGLRNSECRELKHTHIDWNNHRLHLSDSKTVRSVVTRKANQNFHRHWIGIARRWLREHVRDTHIGLIVRLASTPEALEELAHEYGLTSSYRAFYRHYRQRHYANFYQQGWHYLFPREELGSHKAVGDKPVSRQMVYHVCCRLRAKLETKLKGIRVGLHSYRKFAVQRVVSMTKHYLNRSAHHQERVSKRLGAGIGQFE